MADKNPHRKEAEMAAPLSAVSALADVAMRLFADLSASAAPSSPFAVARESLGDRFFDVAVEELRAGLKALLVDTEVLEDLQVAGELAARERMLGVSHRAFQAVIREGAAS